MTRDSPLDTRLSDDWRPSATLETLRLRAELLTQIRAFFAARAVLEVETPVLSRAAGTELHLHSFTTRYSGPSAPPDGCLYLHTSPEYSMKRLLAAGSGSIYQISKVFRDGEAGRRHNPEFTLLEWYRTGFDHLRLMDEVEALVASVLQERLSLRETQRLSYREAFMRHAGIDPHAADTAALADCARRHGITAPAGMENVERTAWLDLLMTHVVEAQLGRDCLCFVYDYPADQASLARIRPGAPALAERFELYVQGVELANGFHELADCAEQRGRFEQDNDVRRARGLPVLPIDEHLLAALAHGLPDCAGVALGLDRLVMLAAEASAIQDVIAFPIDRA